MTRLEAHALLDAVRNGADADEIAINRALVATGDIGWKRAPQIADSELPPIYWPLPDSRGRINGWVSE